MTALTEMITIGRKVVSLIITTTCVILGIIPASLAQLECGCNYDHHLCNTTTSTCITDVVCLRSVTYKNSIVTMDIQLCLQDEIPIQCDISHMVLHGNDVLIEATLCCRTRMCNTNDTLLEWLVRSNLGDNVLDISKINATLTPKATVKATVKATDGGQDNRSHITVIITIVTVLFVVAIAVFIIVSVWLLYKRRCYYTQQVASFDDPSVNLTSHSSNGVDAKRSGESKTISQNIQLIESIGKGHYSEVFLGKRGSQCVAVKVFSTTFEQSWKRERMIYSTFVLENENILQFVDSVQWNTGTQTQLWMVFDYHPQRSLHDYLSNNTITMDQLSKMLVSISTGLAYLHQDFNTGNIYKPAIAHRDLKSSNILVKANDNTCCIADFGLAVVSLDTSKDILEITSNTKQGAIRYMAPEVLDGTINITQFEPFKQADMYSLALVLWEATRRCEVFGGTAEYQLPYAERVVHDPSLEQMKKLVVIGEYRPPILDNWQSHEVLSAVSKIIQECWYSEPSARLTSLRVKKSLQRIFGVTHM